jgi:hypothetical protein
MEAVNPVSEAAQMNKRGMEEAANAQSAMMQGFQTVSRRWLERCQTETHVLGVGREIVGVPFVRGHRRCLSTVHAATLGDGQRKLEASDGRCRGFFPLWRGDVLVSDAAADVTTGLRGAI